MGETRLKLSQILNTEVKLKDDSVSTSPNGDTSWLTKLTLPFTSNGQNWIIWGNAEANVSNTNEHVGIRIRLNGVSVGNVSAVARDLPNIYYHYSCMDFGSVPAGNNTITLEYRSMTGLPVSIRRARLFLMDLS